MQLESYGTTTPHCNSALLFWLIPKPELNIFRLDKSYT